MTFSSFYFDEVNDFTILPAWQDRPLDFLVAPDGMPLSMKIDELPKGKVDFDAMTGRFTYTPSAEDTKEFHVSFEAEGGVENIIRTMRIIPIPNLSPEYKIISNNRPLPDPESADYIRVSERANEKQEFFNGTERTTRTVTISGKTVVLDATTVKNGLYNSYFDDKKDIKELHVYAETIIVRSELKLPQTNVIIFAKELRFEDQKDELPSCIKTIPDDYALTANSATEQKEAADGKEGLQGGSVTLRIGQLHASPGDKKRFVLKGGKGQLPGQGMSGRNGNSMETHPAVETVGSNVVWFGRFHEGDVNPKVEWGTKAWPGSGTPAKRAGTPGAGGKGGDLISNLQEAGTFADLAAGQSADRGGLAIGGKAGTPNPARMVKTHVWTERIGRPSEGNFKVHSRTEEFDKRSFDSYPDLPSPEAPPPLGDGQFRHTPGPAHDWLHPFILQSVLAHAKDAYLNGHLEKTEEVLEEYYKLINEYGPMPEEYELPLTQMVYEIETLLHRLKSNLDYFSNPAGWVPMLSFEANRLAYDNEVESAIPILYLTYWLEGKVQTLETKIKVLGEATSKVKDEVQSNIRDYANTERLIPELRTEANIITNLIELLDTQIKHKENELKERAEWALKGPFWRQALRTIATIAKVVPIYQPVLGSIGAGLEMISNIDSNAPLETFTQLSTISNQFTQAKFEESSNDLKNKLAALDPSKAGNAKEFVKGALPVLKDLNNAQKKMREATEAQQAPKDAVEAELARIKAQDPEFQQLAEKVQDLNVKKENFVRQVAEAMQAVTRLSNQITSNLLAADSMDRELSSKLMGFDHQTMVNIKDMEQRAKERLLKYHYYMAKAYEYRVLKPYLGNLGLNAIFDKFKAIVDDDKNLRVSYEDFKLLRGIYEEPLSDLAFQILTEYNSNRPERSDRITYALTHEEIIELNKLGEVTINLMKAGMLGASEENHRIVELGAREIQADRPGADARDTAILKLTYHHSGRSVVRSEGISYVFTHSVPMIWGTNYDLHDRIPSEEQPSDAAESLLRHLLQKSGHAVESEKVLLFSRPSAWSDIVVRKETKPLDLNIDITNLRIFAKYDFSRVKPNQMVLNVKVADGLVPLIRLDRPDKAGLSNGWGSFTRVYQRGERLKLEAEPTYGEFRFKEWRERGQLLGQQASISVEMSSASNLRMLWAVYEK